jgi:hypothetical protein
MADTRKSPERRVLRCSELHRLEDQLLVLAYEQIRPVSHQRQPVAKRKHQPHKKNTTRTQDARSA